jgi:hypothetical protein
MIIVNIACCVFIKYLLNTQTNEEKHICVSLRLFHCILYKQLVFDHTLMRKVSVGRSCRAIGSKEL